MNGEQNSMKAIIKYFESIGFVPKPRFTQGKWSVTYQRNDDDDWCNVMHRGSKYDVEYVRVYSKDAIRVSKYSSTRMVDIIRWIEQTK